MPPTLGCARPARYIVQAAAWPNVRQGDRRWISKWNTPQLRRPTSILAAVGPTRCPSRAGVLTGSAPDDHAAARRRTGRHRLARDARFGDMPRPSPCHRQTGLDGRGLTPLMEHRWRGGRAHFKLEWFAPTGSFKDRGATVMISTLRQQGVDPVIEDSSGNGGAAIAAYAAAAGMQAKILVPASTQPGKNGPDEGIRGGGRADPGHASGHGRRGRAPGRKRFSTPATIGRPSSSRGQRRWPTSFGRTSGSGRPTTSSYRPARAATSWDATSVSANSCEAGRSAASPALCGPAGELRSPATQLRLRR